MSEEKNCKDGITDIYKAFNCFKNRFLFDGQSLFSEKRIFTLDNLNVIIEQFVKQPDGLNDSWDAKIKENLGDNEDVRELFAHIIWLWSLVDFDMKQDSKIEDVNKWLQDDLQVDKKNCFFFEKGLISTGQYHKINKPAELIYLVKFFEKVLGKNHNTKDRGSYIKIIKAGVDERAEEKEKVSIGGNVKKVAMYNILLHLFDPEKFAPIV